MTASRAAPSLRGITTVGASTDVRVEPTADFASVLFAETDEPPKMKTTYATRRRHERQRIQIDASFARSGSIAFARTRDISLGGAFIETDAPLPYGTDFTIELDVPSIASPVRIDATVRWVSPDGMGVQWGALGARESWAINVLLRISAPEFRAVHAS